MSIINDIKDEYTDKKNHQDYLRRLRDPQTPERQQIEEQERQRQEAEDNDAIEALMAAQFYGRPEMADWDIDAIRDWEDTRL